MAGRRASLAGIGRCVCVCVCVYWYRRNANAVIMCERRSETSFFSQIVTESVVVQASLTCFYIHQRLLAIFYKRGGRWVERQLAHYLPLSRDRPLFLHSSSWQRT